LREVRIETRGAGRFGADDDPPIAERVEPLRAMEGRRAA
jgi:hypothetical protein